MRYKLIMIWLLFCLPVASSAGDKLVFAIDLIRHGDRAPVSKLKNADYEWKEGIGQLTAMGMRQEFELGQSFRKRYIDEAHLLPAQYQAGTIYVRSTDYDRTLMSAQSLLMGLYPQGPGPRDSQPIPIHSSPADTDTIILHHMDRKELHKLQEKYVYSTVAWKQKEAELKPYFKQWSEATGESINELSDLFDLGDGLRIHRLHHLPMPPALSQHDIDLIIEVTDWMAVMEYSARPISALYSQQLMNHITETLEKNSSSGPHLKYALLSAHDSTVASILNLLGAPVTTTPPYASDLNFSVYENGGNRYVVRVTYNGAPVSIPGCDGNQCTLPQFKAAASGNARASG